MKKSFFIPIINDITVFFAYYSGPLNGFRKKLKSPHLQKYQKEYKEIGFTAALTAQRNRHIHRNLLFYIDQPKHLFYSTETNQGKSTLLQQLAIYTNVMGLRVLVIDLDPEMTVTKGLIEDDDIKIGAVQEVLEEFKVVAFDKDDKQTLENLSKLLENSFKDYDLVFIDATIHTSKKLLEIAQGHSDIGMIVCDANNTFSDILHKHDSLEKEMGKKCYLILNKVHPNVSEKTKQVRAVLREKAFPFSLSLNQNIPSLLKEKKCFAEKPFALSNKSVIQEFINICKYFKELFIAPAHVKKLLKDNKEQILSLEFWSQDQECFERVFGWTYDKCLSVMNSEKYHFRKSMAINKNLLFEEYTVKEQLLLAYLLRKQYNIGNFIYENIGDVTIKGITSYYIPGLSQYIPIEEDPQGLPTHLFHKIKSSPILWEKLKRPFIVSSPFPGKRLLNEFENNAKSDTHKLHWKIFEAADLEKSSKPTEEIEFLGEISDGKDISKRPIAKSLVYLPREVFGRKLFYPREYFAMWMKGDYMAHLGIRDGDMLLFHRRNKVYSQNICCVLIKEKDLAIKRVIKEQESKYTPINVRLLSEKLGHDDMLLSHEEISFEGVLAAVVKGTPFVKGRHKSV